MGHIIHLNGDPHEQAQRLLPWYANGTLDRAETDAVEAHLADCADCRAELEADRLLGEEMASLPIDIDRGWAALRGRLDAKPAGRVTPFRRSAPAFLRRPVPLGWAISAQAAAVVLMIGGAFGAARLSAPAPATQSAYHTLSAPAVVAPGNLVVIFRPDTTEHALRDMLIRNQARLVDGPTASDAYVLRVAAGRRDTILAQLRGDRSVVLAEPIDADARP